MNGGKDFELHVRLERQRNRHIRLTRASLCLLLVAVACWLLGLGSGWQLAAGLLAGIAGLAWPVHGSPAWALEKINAHGGLAYETALALETQPRDDFGLRAQVRSRARSAMAGFERPAQTEWWIAALIVGLVVLFLPMLQIHAPWSGRSVPPPDAQAALPVPEDDSPEQEDEPEAEEEPEVPAEPEEVAAPEAQMAETPDSSPADELSDGPGTAPESEGMVLDRFLDNLRSRPPSEQPEVSEMGNPAPAPAQDPPQVPETESERTSPGEDPGAGADSQQGEGDQTGEAGGQGEPGGQDQSEGDGGQQEDSAGGDGESAGAQEQASPDAGTEAPADQPGGGLDAGVGDGEGAGGGAGTEVMETEAQRPGEASGDEEFLEGILSGDEVNLGGDVRLPGFDDVELPPAASPTGLGRAVERSLTEGTVPLEYQEVIRNYFR